MVFVFAAQHLLSIVISVEYNNEVDLFVFSLKLTFGRSQRETQVKTIEFLCLKEIAVYV